MAEPFSIGAGVVGITDVAFSSIKKLHQVLESIRDAPRAIRTIQQELEVIQGTLPSLQSALEAKSTAGNDVSPLEIAVCSCTNDCDKFRARLVTWTSHSSEQKTSFRDSVRVGILYQSQITSFLRRLEARKNTILLALACDEFVRSVESKKDEEKFESRLVLKEQEVEKEASSAREQIARVDESMKQLSQNELQDPADISNLADLQEESRVFQSHLDICREEHSRLQSWREDQTISGVRVDDSSRLATGIINCPSDSLQVKQRIDQVSATGGSRGIIGIADKVDLDSFFK